MERKLAYRFEPMGEQHVKNIAEPVAVYRVLADRYANSTTPVAPFAADEPSANRDGSG